MRSRYFLLLLAVVAVGAAAALWMVRRQAPPRSATLLPPSDGVFYVNVELLRKAGVFSRSHSVQRDADFQQFVSETGFDFERDLDEVSFAVHNAAPGGRDDYPRFSEVFLGRIDVVRAGEYFRKLARSTEQYRNVDIYAIPHEGRTVRVALLDESTAAASNTESADAMHAIIDSWKQASTRNALVSERYPAVPFGSVAWLLARVAPPPGLPQSTPAQGLTSPAWLRDIAGGSVVVASLRYVGALQLRAVAFAPTAADASRIAQNANSWLAVFRTVEQNVETSGTDPDIKATLASLKVQQEGDRAVVSADVPMGLLKKLAIEPPPLAGTPASPAAKKK